MGTPLDFVQKEPPVTPESPAGSEGWAKLPRLLGPVSSNPTNAAITQSTSLINGHMKFITGAQGFKMNEEDTRWPPNP